ncbi:MAG: DNA polymerase III subunit chi [Alphaproteobacteria bacterium]|nr:DNA polymerase III subunit chi [Alphaproteobacteria bacterium]
MTEVSLYHLTTIPLERVLPKLLEKIIASGKRSLVLAASEERVEMLNNALWTYAAGSFLPHGSSKDGFPEHQPIWLSANPDPLNGATIVVLTESVDAPALENFERCIDIFDGLDDDATALAKKRIQHYNNNGHNITYWQQDSKGVWEKKLDF